MAIAVVEERLGAVSNTGERSRIAMNLAETCYECYRIEDDFRDLIDKDPSDLDGILTALVNLEIGFGHLRDHLIWLKRPLDRAIRTVDRTLDKPARSDGRTSGSRRVSTRD